MNEIILNNQIQNNINNNIVEKQDNFLKTSLGKALNTGFDIALRAALPDLIEEQIIDVKDVLMQEGLKEGFNTIVNSAIDLGKSAAGIFTGKFENTTQIENVVKKGGIIDSTSELLDNAINIAKKKDLLDTSTASVLKKGKNAVLNSINNSVENMLTDQIKSVEKLEKNIINWKEAYQNQDIKQMEKQFKKIDKELSNIMPLENLIKEAREIENIHNLIKNNGNVFNLSTSQLELAKKLV